jgi:hypothetical protein
MNRCLQGIAAATVAAALIFASAAPAMASAQEFEERDAVPILFDAIVLRPLGLAVTALGGLIFAFPVAPVIALTRPSELHEQLDFLVLRPARYTFSDPLGRHDPLARSN